MAATKIKTPEMSVKELADITHDVYEFDPATKPAHGICKCSGSIETEFEGAGGRNLT